MSKAVELLCVVWPESIPVAEYETALELARVAESTSSNGSTPPPGENCVGEEVDHGGGGRISEAQRAEHSRLREGRNAQGRESGAWPSTAAVLQPARPGDLQENPLVAAGG